MKTKLFLTGLILTVFFNCCTTPLYLPKSNKIDVNEYGSYIKVKQKTGAIVQGELISIDKDQLIVLSDSKKINGTIAIPVSQVLNFQLRYAQPKHYEWTIPLYVLSTLSHGFFLIFTAPVNLIVTIVVSTSGENAFTYSEKDMTFDRLKMFARFPQGVPPSIDIAKIR